MNVRGLFDDCRVPFAAFPGSADADRQVRQSRLDAAAARSAIHPLRSDCSRRWDRSSWASERRRNLAATAMRLAAGRIFEYQPRLRAARRHVPTEENEPHATNAFRDGSCHNQLLQTRPVSCGGIEPEQFKAVRNWERTIRRSSSLQARITACGQIDRATRRPKLCPMAGRSLLDIGIFPTGDFAGIAGVARTKCTTALSVLPATLFTCN